MEMLSLPPPPWLAPAVALWRCVADPLAATPACLNPKRSWLSAFALPTGIRLSADAPCHPFGRTDPASKLLRRSESRSPRPRRANLAQPSRDCRVVATSDGHRRAVAKHQLSSASGSRCRFRNVSSIDPIALMDTHKTRRKGGKESGQARRHEHAASIDEHHLAVIVGSLHEEDVAFSDTTRAAALL